MDDESYDRRHQPPRVSATNGSTVKPPLSEALECRVERESFTDKEVRALIADARQDERLRCRNRINVLIEVTGYQRESLGGAYPARLSALMAARSAVMRGDDGDATPV